MRFLNSVLHINDQITLFLQLSVQSCVTQGTGCYEDPKVLHCCIILAWTGSSGLHWLSLLSGCQELISHSLHLKVTDKEINTFSSIGARIFKVTASRTLTRELQIQRRAELLFFVSDYFCNTSGSYTKWANIIMKMTFSFEHLWLGIMPILGTTGLRLSISSQLQYIAVYCARKYVIYYVYELGHKHQPQAC